jgi:hypothetical protein
LPSEKAKDGGRAEAFFWSENLRSSEGEWGSDVMVRKDKREKRDLFGWRL